MEPHAHDESAVNEEDSFLGSGSSAADDSNETRTSANILSMYSAKKLLLYTLPALLLCQFFISFDGSYVIGNYSRRIALELHQFQNAPWIVLGFLVTESALSPLYGHAAQVYGHRAAVLFAAVIFSIGLLLSSLSHRLWQLAISRVVVGIGTAGIELLVVVIINDLVKLYELPLWTSAMVFCNTIGLMLGGPVGAALTDRLGFRPVFGFEFAGMLLTIVILYLTLQLSQVRAKRSSQDAKRIEFPSSISLLAAMAVPLFALNLGGEIFPWSHPVIIVLFCLTPVLVLLFYYVESRIAETRIVPKRFINNRHVAIALACTLPMKFAFDQLRFSFGTYLEARSFQDKSPFGDWALTFIYFGRSIGMLLAGLLVRRYRRFKLFLKANIVADLVIYSCFAVGLIHPEKPAFAPILVFIGGTEGFAEGLWLVAILSLVVVEDQSLLYAFFGVATAIAGDLGIAVSLATEGSLVRFKLKTQLGDYPDADNMIRKSLEDLNYIRDLPEQIQSIILNAITSSSEVAFGISCLVLILSFFASFYVKEMPR